MNDQVAERNDEAHIIYGELNAEDLRRDQLDVLANQLAELRVSDLVQVLFVTVAVRLLLSSSHGSRLLLEVPGK